MGRCTTIVAKRRVIGFHQYPDAPEEVRFLASRHRHEFTIEVAIEVTDSNRETEWFMVGTQLMQYLERNWVHHAHGFEFADMSCEQIAHAILDHFDRASWVAVTEDDECYAHVERIDPYVQDNSKFTVQSVQKLVNEESA